MTTQTTRKPMKAAPAAPAAPLAKAPKPPAGFTPIESGSRIDGYFRRAPGAEIMGILQSRKINDKGEGYYTLTLTSPCAECIRYEEGVEEAYDAQVGDNVVVSEFYRIQPWQALLEQHGAGAVTVWLGLGEKTQIPGTNRSVWEAQVAYRVKGDASGRPARGRAVDYDDGGDSVQF